jgi:phage shock protein C
MRDPLYRSRTDRVIGGLAGGLARSLGVDVTWVRLGWVVLAFVTQGVAILIYLVLLFVIPEEPEGYVPTEATGPDGGPSGAAFADPAPTSPAGSGPGRRPTNPPPPSPLEQWLGGSGRDSSRTGALIVGLVLVAVGAWLLIRRYVLIDFDLGWPVVALALGVILIVAALRTGGRRG